MTDGPFQGMAALVTGAGSGRGLAGPGDPGPGIGGTIAGCLAREGAAVAVNDLDAEAAETTARDIRTAGGVAEAIVADVSDPEQAARLVEAAIGRFGRLDILVNSAGMSGAAKAIERLPVDVWLRVMGVNLNGPFFTCRAAIPHMREQGFGRIINVSSAAGGLRISNNGGADYTTSKTGLLGFTRHLAAEVGQHGITVNAVCPGSIIKRARRERMAPEELARAARRSPVGRPGDPQDIASVVAFLASREASYVSGQAIAVDGAANVLPGDFGAYRAAGRKDYG